MLKSFKLLILSLFLIGVILFIPKVEAQSCYQYTYSLQIGSTDIETNGEVSRLQNYLYNLGYLPVSPTGYYGTLTRTAVSRYQISQQIAPLGIVGPLTRNALSCGSNQSPINNNQNTESFSPINMDLGCIESNYDYKKGSKDYALFGQIMKLQTYLYQNNLMFYPPTGYFGDLTEEALLKYQNLRKLPITGVYDYPTRDTLAKETCGGVSNLIPPIIYTAPNNPYTSQTPQ